MLPTPDFSAMLPGFFSAAPTLVSVPGRVNLIGEHTDYNEGYVLPGASDLALWLAFQQVEGEAFTAHSMKYGREATISMANSGALSNNSWTKYIRAAVAELRHRGFAVGGFRVAIGGDLPVGAGMSSSSALTTGILFGLCALYGWAQPPMQMALMAQAAEYRTGTRGGLMDQMTILHAKAGHLILLDCLDLSFRQVPADFGDYQLLLLDTRVEHDLVTSEYNLRRAQCEDAVNRLRAAHLRVRALRDVTTAMLSPFREKWPAQIFRRADFVVRENGRVLDAARALRGGNLTKVGKLLDESHAGLRADYEVSCPELDLMAGLARQQPEVLGARMMGGGFGGCTINLVAQVAVPSVIEKVLDAYHRATGIAGAAYPVTLSGHARQVG
jgi:galactokinase